MQENSERRYIEEDEIDLRELFKTLWDKKLFIVVFTTLVTVLAVVYALMKTPIYEARALLEIGNYKINNNNKVQLDNANQLSKKLNILFIDMYKNVKEKKSEISSITVPKNQEGFIELKFQAISNDLAKNEIEKVVAYIQKEHQVILDDIKDRREFEIANIDKQIQSIQGRETKFMQKQIDILEKSLKRDREQLKKININFKTIDEKSPALAALSLIQAKDLSISIDDKNLQILEVKNKKERLITSEVSRLKEEQNILKSMLLPHSYKNSEIVGEIILNDHPIKPKKKLIVVVAFVTGFILSVFMVFFLQFIRDFREEDKGIF